MKNAIVNLILTGQTRKRPEKWAAIRAHFPLSSDFYCEANGTDLRTGTAYTDASAARRVQTREDRELRTDMRALQLGLTGRAERVERLRDLFAENTFNRPSARRVLHSIRRMIYDDVRALRVGV